MAPGTAQAGVITFTRLPVAVQLSVAVGSVQVATAVHEPPDVLMV